MRALGSIPRCDSDLVLSRFDLVLRDPFQSCENDLCRLWLHFIG
jgi:hypothetical protein